MIEKYGHGGDLKYRPKLGRQLVTKPFI